MKAVAFWRLFTEFSTTISQEGVLLPCIICQERKSKKPSNTATLLELGVTDIFPSVLMVVTAAFVVDLNPVGAFSA